MKVMVIGDPHGGVSHIATKVQWMKGIQHMLVCGDFGLWTHFKDGVQFLDEINEIAAKNHFDIYAVGGNHENWDHWNWFCDNMPKDKCGFATVREHVRLAPRLHMWKWGHKNFFGAGGAVSVDREWRLQKESGYDRFTGTTRSGTGPRTLYWPNEILTDEHVDEAKQMMHAVRAHGKQIDYLVTHDCSDKTPFYDRMKEDLESKIHRQRIDEVIKAVKPKVHFHGHMHNKFDWQNRIGGDQWVQTYGLECNKAQDSWGILDTDTDGFEFATGIRWPNLH